ncbi:2062_t:CDS:2 [Entrophospora sp. SA101]|nr:2062_t:CDS:2 [Entrophospora sp. SA101]
MNLRDIGKLETWDRFFDYLINTYYYRFRQQLGIPFGYFQSEPVVRFGELAIYNRTIYLNRLFLYQQLGLRVYFINPTEFKELFGLDNLIRVLAHELGHVVLTDTQPATQEINGGHGKEHDKVQAEILKLIETSSEYQELKNY